MQKAQGSQNTTNGTTLEFRLGSHFIESVNKRGLDSNEIFLRSLFQAAADVILEKVKVMKGYRLHALRKSKAADTPQRIRESDRTLAWRLMLQKQGAGWRLHYWQIPTSDGSMIEFANVCKESESEIF